MGHHPLLVALLGLFVLISSSSAAIATLSVSSVAPLLSAEDAEPIPESYIVILKPDVRVSFINEHLNWLTTLIATNPQANKIKHTYDFNNIRGYAGKFEPHVIDMIRSSNQIAYLEQDQRVHVFNPISVSHPVPSKKKTLRQTDAPWGLSRISHRSIPPAASYHTYDYPPSAGKNVSVYVVDTGINIKHVDFEGRASWGATIPADDEDVDGNGHGTHCAGTIAGKRYGVAKKANVIAVKVLSSNGSGSMSDVIKGVEFVIQDHLERVKSNTDARSAANMSLGGGRSRTLDKAVNAGVKAGIHFAVAAGNDNRDACNYSPAAAEEAVTVGASAIDDKMAWFSNHGKCVDVFAPGKDITSTWIGSNVAINTISGTSMAAPHVAGLLALLLGENPTVAYTGKELKDLVIKISTKDAIKGIPKKGSGSPPRWPFPWPPGGDDDDDEGKTPNRLIYTGVPNKKDTPEENDDVVSIFKNPEAWKVGEEITPGFEPILDQLVSEAMEQTEGILGWMKSRIEKIKGFSVKISVV